MLRGNRHVLRGCYGNVSDFQTISTCQGGWRVANMSATSRASHARGIWRTTRQTDKRTKKRPIISEDIRPVFTKFSPLVEEWMQIINLAFILSSLQGRCYGNQFSEQIVENRHRLFQSEPIYLMMCWTDFSSLCTIC